MVPMSSTAHPSPINLIVGGDEFLTERRRLAIVRQARVASGNDDLPVEMHKATDISAPELAEMLSPSLFAEERIIVITGVENAGKETVTLIEQAISDPADGVVLILTHTGAGRNKKLVQSWPKMGATVHQAAELKGRERQAFVDQEFRHHEVRVSGDVTQLLLDVVGTDLRELASAVSQLVADTDGNVDVAVVKKYYAGKAEVSGFEVAEQAVNGQVAAAVSLTRRALQLGTPTVLLASALSTTVADIAKVAGNRVNSRQDAAAFGMPPWKLEKTARIARSWSPAMVARAVQIVADLDAGVKGHSANAEFAVESAVRSIAHVAATRSVHPVG